MESPFSLLRHIHLLSAECQNPGFFVFCLFVCFTLREFPVCDLIRSVAPIFGGMIKNARYMEHLELRDTLLPREV